MLKVQLDDFRAQRTAGMGGMFGPPDPKLRAAEETVDRRLAVINERLVPLLDSMAEDLENASDKTATLCAALPTVMAKVFVTKDAKALGIKDKIPTTAKHRTHRYGRLQGGSQEPVWTSIKKYQVHDPDKGVFINHLLHLLLLHESINRVAPGGQRVALQDVVACAEQGLQAIR